MQGKEPRYLIGSTPVNRRTASTELTAPAKSPVVTARLQQRQLRKQLGPPLADLLRPSTSRAPLSAGSVVAAVLGATAGVGVLLGGLQGSAITVVAGAAGLLGAGVLVLRAARRRPGPVAPLLFDADPVAAFDRAIDAPQGQVAPELVVQLGALKQQLARIARSPAAGTTNEHFTVDDRLYLNECLRRYIPDTLEAYLTVHASERGVPVERQTGLQMALAQLSLLADELERREQKLLRSAAEALHRQQRFLQAKSSDER